MKDIIKLYDYRIVTRNGNFAKSDKFQEMTRIDAINFMENCIYGCEGSERDDYLDTLIELKNFNKKEFFIQDDARYILI